MSFFNGGANVSHPNFVSSTPQLIDFISYSPDKPLLNREFLHQKYVTEGLSLAQISREIFSSKSTIRKALMDNGIPLRELHRPHGNSAQLRFGRKKIANKVVPHLAELRVVRAIEDLRSKGFSLRQIAQFLTQIKVPTKLRGKAWHPQMIKRILTPP